MKTKFCITAILITMIFSGSVNAQTINWAGMKEENKLIVNVNLNWDYGVTYGMGFGYKFKTWVFPSVVSIEYSSPSGEQKLDDFKSRLGIQVRLADLYNFQISARIQGVFRRTECEMVRLLNFGSDMSVMAGYYRKIWFFAAEGGFDKSIVTNFRHSRRAIERYPDVVGGWYQPSNGGNFYYGLQAGLTFWKNDIYVKAGKVINQNLESTPIVPFYAQVGYNLKFR